MNMSMTRHATINRSTKETTIEARLQLDGTGVCEAETGLAFLDHMLDQLARHSGMDISISCDGDVHVDGHHTAEDCGIVLGKAFDECLGNRAGIVRFGSALAPLDEALSEVVVDCCGRAHFEWRVTIPTPKLGDSDSEIFREFFKAFADNARITLHVDNRHGINGHHIVESCFKAAALALRQAVRVTGTGIPSTKGVL